MPQGQTQKKLIDEGGKGGGITDGPVGGTGGGTGTSGGTGTGTGGGTTDGGKTHPPQTPPPQPQDKKPPKTCEPCQGAAKAFIDAFNKLTYEQMYKAWIVSKYEADIAQGDKEFKSLKDELHDAEQQLNNIKGASAGLKKAGYFDQQAYDARVKELEGQIKALTKQVSNLADDLDDEDDELAEVIQRENGHIYEAMKAVAKAKKALDACQKKCALVPEEHSMVAPNSSSSTELVSVGTGDVQVEEVHLVTGVNPFDPSEIESIFNNVNANTFVMPPSNGGGAPPPAAPPPSGGGTNTPTQSIASVSVTHTVGSSACPTSFSPVTVSAGGSAVTISGVSVSGVGASRVTATASGSGGTAPTINASFNCSSSTDGTYPATVSYTATVGSTATPLSFTATVTVQH